RPAPEGRGLRRRARTPPARRPCRRAGDRAGAVRCDRSSVALPGVHVLLDLAREDLGVRKSSAGPPAGGIPHHDGPSVEVELTRGDRLHGSEKRDADLERVEIRPTDVPTRLPERGDGGIDDVLWWGRRLPCRGGMSAARPNLRTAALRVRCWCKDHAQGRKAGAELALCDFLAQNGCGARILAVFMVHRYTHQRMGP